MTGGAPLLDVDDLDARRQYRSAAGAGAASAGPQLDGARACSRPATARPRTPRPRRCPTGTAATSREFQLNMDGQQVSAEIGFGGQPRFSRDAIAEFQFISNRFDATQGRSSGVQVNADHRVGHQQPSPARSAATSATAGSTPRTPPRTACCRSTTSSSPHARRPDPPRPAALLRQLRVRARAAESVWNTPYPASTSSWKATHTLKMGGGRLDYQLSTSTRADGQGLGHARLCSRSAGRQHQPSGRHAVTRRIAIDEYLGSAHAGAQQPRGERGEGRLHARTSSSKRNLTNWSNHWQAPNGNHQRLAAHPVHRLHHRRQPVPSAGRRAGRLERARRLHVLVRRARAATTCKAGGEYLRIRDYDYSCRFCARPASTPGTARFPPTSRRCSRIRSNVDTWNLAAISPLVRTYDIGVGDFHLDDIRPKFGAWAQDDWQIASALTLNLGLRYDLSAERQRQRLRLPPFVEAGPYRRHEQRPAARGLRLPAERSHGGARRHRASTSPRRARRRAPLDGAQRARSRRSSSPTTAGRTSRPIRSTASRCRRSSRRGERFCHVRNVPGLSRALTVGELSVPSLNEHLGVPGSRRSASSASSATRWRWKRTTSTARAGTRRTSSRTSNLTFNPATGANYPFSDISRRPTRSSASISMQAHTGWSSYHALQTVFTKRLSNRWQALGDLHAVGILGRGSAAAQRHHAGAVPDRARPRRRIHPVDERPAASGGVQRHLAARAADSR